MRNRIIQIILLALLAGGCSLLGSEKELIIEPVYAEEATVESQGNLQVTFTVHSRWSNSCGRFSRFDIQRTDSIYSVKMFGQQPKGATCLTVITPIKGTETVQVLEAGTYTFQFWRGKDTPLDTTLTVE